MITSTQATEYLDQALGVSVPSFIVDAAVAEVATAEAAMVAAGYGTSKQVLVQSMAVAIKAAAGSPRRIQSQGAPSGASRSFKNPDGDLTALRRSLAALDTAGTVAAIVGPDPAGSTLFMVV
ncbi:DUF7370 family protein [Roseateles terrae]|uniref:Uncharacterized protein n=1 Tax=Roseateles terrae TaxID=431060 RepID=A0ABR6GP96_9BURK|nr:hypothetical protein [Roseateles terrae]MBB3193941.1 hypothetical protein [Roseateles terrae]OWQ87819.1 hypothetical protein CDN98_06545 [Roseateles terrae]